MRGAVLLVALSWAGLAWCLCMLSLTAFIKIKDSIASARWLAWGGGAELLDASLHFTPDMVLPSWAPGCNK